MTYLWIIFEKGNDRDCQGECQVSEQDLPQEVPNSRWLWPVDYLRTLPPESWGSHRRWKGLSHPEVYTPAGAVIRSSWFIGCYIIYLLPRKLWCVKLWLKNTPFTVQATWNITCAIFQTVGIIRWHGGVQRNFHTKCSSQIRVVMFL